MEVANLRFGNAKFPQALWMCTNIENIFDVVNAIFLQSALFISKLLIYLKVYN